MPQVFRRHSDYNPRPSLVPRRRSSMAPPGPDPQPTDADDSIVLADLVRTGEASRLRRRGALRLDHGPANVPRPANAGPGPSSYAPPTRPIVIEPSRTPSPELGADAGADEYTYTAGPVWREWDAVGMGMSRTQARGPEGVQAVEILNESAQAGHYYTLYCGGEDLGVVEEEEPPRRFEPSLFPEFPASSSSVPAASSSARRSAVRTNGCGALVHVRAYPQRPRGVWMAKEDAAETVVGLDSAYCDHPAMDKMLKSACGCIREGIGCSVCGNTLGTRYVPCQAASESIFSPSSSSSIAPSPPRPHRPSGPSYWNARSTPPHRRSSTVSSRGRPSSYYTFFADRVSASPAYDLPPHTAAVPTFAEPRRGGNRPVSPEIDYGYRWTASPQPVTTPLPMSGSSTAISVPTPPSPVFALPPLPPAGRSSSSQLRPASSFRPQSLALNTPNRGFGLELDPDGVPLGDMAEPSSPDKESMPWPGR